MKKMFAILITVVAIVINSNAQYYNGINEDNDSLNLNENQVDNNAGDRSLIDFYGLEINGFNSKSGFDNGLEAALYVKDKNKLLEVGAYFDSKTMSLSGLSITHKRYFNKKELFNITTINPYLFYNFIYRVTFLDSMATANTDFSRFIGKTEARYASIEHYVGAGFELHLRNYFYINTYLGYGYFMGSIKRPTLSKNSIGVYQGSNGWCEFFKVGFGFRIP
jgi:hypothetical protein